MRDTWEKKIPYRGWNKVLRWIKSGTASKVYDTPYEIFLEWYGPTQLSVGSTNIDIQAKLSSKLRDILEHPRFDSDYLIEALVTAVVGKPVDTKSKARAAYRERNYLNFKHSKRYRIVNLNQLLSNVLGILDDLAQHPSRAGWLVSIQVTVRFDEGDEGKVKHSGTHRETD